MKYFAIINCKTSRLGTWICHTQSVWRLESLVLRKTVASVHCVIFDWWASLFNEHIILRKKRLLYSTDINQHLITSILWKFANFKFFILIHLLLLLLLLTQFKSDEWISIFNPIYQAPPSGWCKNSINFFIINSINQLNRRTNLLHTLIISLNSSQIRTSRYSI